MQRWLYGALIALIACGGAQARPLPVVPRTVGDILADLDRYRPDPEVRSRMLAAAAARPPVTEDPAVLARFYHQRARAAEALDLSRQRADDLEQALPYARKAKLKPTAEGGDEARVLAELSNAWLLLDYRRGLWYAEQAIANPRLNIGYVLGYTTNMAQTYVDLGDYEAARALLVRADAKLAEAERRPDASGWTLYGPGYRSYVEGAWAYFYRGTGKLREAEARYRAAVEAATEDLRLGAARRAANRSTRTDDTIVGVRVAHGRALAVTLRRMGRFEEAEALMRESLAETVTHFGVDSYRVANQLRALADLLNDEGRVSEALALMERAVRIAAAARLPATSFSSVYVRRDYASNLVHVGRYEEAIVEFEALRHDASSDPRLARAALDGSSRPWALALIRTGRAAQAAAMLRTSIAVNERVTGPRSYATAIDRGYLGIALAEQGERADALLELRASLDILAGAEDDNLEYIRRSDQASRSVSNIVAAYINLLSSIDGARTQVDPAAESFRVSDLMRGQPIQRAVLAAAARAAAGSPELADLVRKQQDLGDEERALYRVLAEQVSLPVDERSPATIAGLRAQLAEVSQQRALATRGLAERYPSYANFVNPKPPTLAKARDALRPGEVLVSLLSTRYGTFVWAVPKTGPVVFQRAAMTEKGLAEKVARLRVAVEFKGGAEGALPEFDVGLAHELFEALLKPVAAAFEGSNSLYVVSGGSLAQLPLTLLVEAPTGTNESGNVRYANVRWLANRFAISHVPSVNAFVTLRDSRLESRAAKMFSGFGDPQFGAVGSKKPSSPLPPVRNLGIARVSGQDVKGGLSSDWWPYSKLAPLPDTREEILSIAATLRADPQTDVFLGVRANKSAVASPGVANSRIVAFATHGLLPGDLPGLVQPALALSPPQGADVDSDPSVALLTMEDVLGLKLNAEWVVLSACNTAAGDGAGAEAVSGLGRAFFYAGSRALLVTHWPVETVSARLLVTKTFELYAADTSLPRAEALRRAMLDVMRYRRPGSSAGSAPYGHPWYWAPYALIGDGGR